jgi:2-oxoglutarate dehydrogenase E2 component (dihydrolipoamide succinyltransferase)
MEIRIPEVGESVREALLAKWFKKNGELVRKDESLCEIETDKITLDIHADTTGILSIQIAEGTTVPIGTVVAVITEQSEDAQFSPGVFAGKTPAASRGVGFEGVASSPSTRREMREKGIDPGSVRGTGKGGRITRDDLAAGRAQESRPSPEAGPAATPSASMSSLSLQSSVKSPDPVPVPPVAERQVSAVRSEESPPYLTDRVVRKPMSPIRRRIAERMVAARQQTAMLTTFNEVDLSQVKFLREKYRDQFQERHGAAPGLMPFFVRACVEALKEYPSVNASIDGEDLVYHNYYDIGIAIGAEKGLVVPVLRDADTMRMYEIDQAIVEFSEKIKTNLLALSDLEGGTFSISNGGVYGSMLSTPILNIPQSGVLGMHAIQDRPVVRDGQVVIRPMMYLALSYDHRIIDGREAVGFLRKVKECIEDPQEFLLEG